MRVLLLGATDLSLAVAERLVAVGLPLAGIVHAGQIVRISYAREGFTNVRSIDMAGWAEQHLIVNEAWSDAAALAAFTRRIEADAILAAGWYHMVPQSVRTIPRFGALGLHASLLPKLRGGAPLNWAILSGLTETGITLFQLGDGVDDGLIYGQKRFPIGSHDTIGDLVAQSEKTGLDLIAECLPAIAKGTLTPQPQDHTQASYCLQRVPEDSHIDWQRSAASVDRLVRASARPYAGAYSTLDGRRLTIWKGKVMDGPNVLGAPGQIARLPDDVIAIVTGDGLYRIEQAEYEDEDAFVVLSRSVNRRLAS